MQLSSDAELGRIPRKYTMPFAASGAFGAALYSYVVDGTVLASRSAIPRPVRNEGGAISLLNHMERFAMAHELAHIKADHLSGAATLEQEYEADALSLGLITTLAREDHGSWAVGYWACELELVALNLLYRALGVMAFGPVKLRWISTTHPDPLSRRERIRQIWLSPRVPADGAFRDDRSPVSETLGHPTAGVDDLSSKGRPPVPDVGTIDCGDVCGIEVMARTEDQL